MLYYNKNIIGSNQIPMQKQPTLSAQTKYQCKNIRNDPLIQKLTKTSICCSVMLAKQAPTALSKDSSTQP
jgi:hypothetical protein